MADWIRKILTGQRSFLERLSNDDWIRLIDFARMHILPPILYHSFKDSPPANLSDHSLQELRNIYFANADRNILLYHELGKVLRALREAHIPVIVLKGACLAEAVYSNIALRSMVDVDLFVKNEDMTKTVHILRNLGYSAGYEFQAKEQKAVLLHLPPMKGEKRLSIEVHWTIFDFTYFAAPEEKEMEKLWERAKPVVIAEVPVLMLGAEDLLLHLCLHISMQHLFEMRLRDFLDLKKVVEIYGDGIDWDLLQQSARRWNCNRAVRLTLYLAEQYVGLNMPEQVKQKWKPEPIDPAMMSWIEEKILGEAPLIREGKLTDFLYRKTLSEKALILWQRFFPPRAMLARIYDIDAADRKIYLYYPVRWLTLFKRFGPIVWNAWREDVRVVTPLQKENALRQWLANKSLGQT